ncbi:MAG: hypothetical protein IMW96_11420 [Thermoanaerobacteraceae bacterium]|nr:hypothetical protein [Thermoanaerobacteraceae bacterium]
MNLVALRGIWATDPEPFHEDGALRCILEAEGLEGTCPVPVVVRTEAGRIHEGARVFVIGTLMPQGETLFVQANVVRELPVKKRKRVVGWIKHGR